MLYLATPLFPMVRTVQKKLGARERQRTVMTPKRGFSQPCL